ncbi:hypothetical protein C1645_838399 [Glomus cerebriforme]|uniref:Uncharacterized protein n=1 Tax=Glomus cerebriforme TaxID=658196 RepID=A0A397S3P2_9GLOM|nr:hypothetical protein C1645_838399 [Glomus cerebriforme]
MVEKPCVSVRVTVGTGLSKEVVEVVVDLVSFLYLLVLVLDSFPFFLEVDPRVLRRDLGGLIERNELFSLAPEEMNTSARFLEERTLRLDSWRNELFGSASGERTLRLNSWRNELFGLTPGRTNTSARLLEERLFGSAPGGETLPPSITVCKVL